MISNDKIKLYCLKKNYLQSKYTIYETKGSINMKSVKALPVKVLPAVIMILALCFSLPVYGADGESPSEAVGRDIEVFRENARGNGVNGIVDLSGHSGYSQEDMEMLSEKLCDFEYEIVGEEAEEDTAAVTVKVTTYNFGKELQKVIREIFFDNLFSFSDPENIDEEEIVEILRDRLGGLEKKKYSEKVVINCTKENGEWVSDLDKNQEFRNAAFGGVISVIRKYEEYL